MKLKVGHLLRQIKIAFGDLDQLKADLSFLVVNVAHLEGIAYVDNDLFVLLIQVKTSAITVGMLT